MSITVHIDGNRQSEIDEFPEELETVGQYADLTARDNIGSSDAVDREFSFKVDGEVADRDKKLSKIKDGAFLELVEVTELEETTPDAVVDDGSNVKPPTIKEITDEVAGDPVKAQAALDDELARPEKDQRSSLVEKLQAIITPPQP